MRYTLTMFGDAVLIGLSRLVHAHIAYEIDSAKIIAAFSRICYCLYDFLRLNSIACRVQATRCTVMQFSLVVSVINWLCLGFVVLIGLSQFHNASIAYETDTSEIIAAFCRISHCLHDLMRLNSIVRHVQTTRCTTIWFSRIDSDINWICMKCVYW